LRILKQRLVSRDHSGAGSYLLPAMNVAVAIILAVVSFRMILPYFETTGGLIRQTRALSSSIAAKYHEAVTEICRRHSEITQADMEFASKSWGIEWRAKQLADTNQLPKCST
jgi:hypothetical protein